MVRASDTRGRRLVSALVTRAWIAGVTVVLIGVVGSALHVPAVPEAEAGTIVDARAAQVPPAPSGPQPAPVQVPRTEPEAPSTQAPSPIVNWQWRVQQFRTGDALTRPLPETPNPLSALFADDGRVSGSSGCNSYTGSYAVAGSSISFSQLASTRRACSQPGVMAQEQAFLTALTASQSFAVTGEMLRLLDGAGTVQVTLMRPSIQPVPSKPSSSQPAAPSGGSNPETQGPPSAASAADPTAATSIQMPGGTVCRFAGTGATLAFDGKRASYTRGSPDIVLLGDPATTSPV